jgi:hypothetical protein
MFGPDDALLNTLVQLLRRLPIYPMFGRGETRMQPADVEDVGEAVAELMQRTAAEAITVECGGPRVHTYEELLRTITRAANVKRILVPVPFAAWQALAWVAEMLPGARVHAQSGGADGDRYRGIGWRSRLCRPWDFTQGAGGHSSNHLEARVNLLFYYWITPREICGCRAHRCRPSMAICIAATAPRSSRERANATGFGVALRFRNG